MHGGEGVQAAGGWVFGFILNGLESHAPLILCQKLTTANRLARHLPRVTIVTILGGPMIPETQPIIPRLSKLEFNLLLRNR